MAEVTNELIFEVLKSIQRDLVDLRTEVRSGDTQTQAALNALRTHFIGLQQDVTNIYTMMVRYDQRLDRIERRLELTETV